MTSSEGDPIQWIPMRGLQGVEPAGAAGRGCAAARRTGRASLALLPGAADGQSIVSRGSVMSKVHHLRREPIRSDAEGRTGKAALETGGAGWRWPRTYSGCS
jgi:hypothetical protein